MYKRLCLNYIHQSKDRFCCEEREAEENEKSHKKQMNGTMMEFCLLRKTEVALKATGIHHFK